MSNEPERKNKIYGGAFGVSGSTMYINDQRKMTKQGWRVVSATEIGKGRLNVIYERGDTQSVPQQPTTPLNVQNLELLLGMLNNEEKAQFENSVQQIVNQWLARKATGQ
jgi:uncharacterized protein YkwD